MKFLITYDDFSRYRFDEETQSALDTLSKNYPLVQVERDKSVGDNNRWFVQVSESSDQLPVGVFGSSVKEAADRLATALKIVD